MYRCEFTPKARAALRKLACKNPKATQAIIRKIEWLAEHADNIAHRPIKGSTFFSLHSGSFRIPYLLDAANHVSNGLVGAGLPRPYVWLPNRDEIHPNHN